MNSWIYDRQLTMFTTINGELSLMMLIEAYELNGISVISANTDGVTVLVKKADVDKMMRINKNWCDITKFELERTDYQKIIFSTVNDYLAIKTDGEVKKKGDFLTDFELHKNKSKRIIPMALEKWFVDGTPVEETIRNHKNIYDFVIRQKASRDFHYEGISDISRNVYNKLIRYYISTNGEKILKVKNPECQTNAAEISQVEAGEWLAIVCNRIDGSEMPKNINYKYYIEKCNEMIAKIAYGGKKKIIKKDPNQLNLF